MSSADKNISLVSEVVKLTDRQEIPIVRNNDNLEAVIEAFAGAVHSRLVYVIDEKEKLCGVISLGGLTRHLLFFHEGGGIDNLHLTSMALAENAGDFVDGPPFTVHMAENVDEVMEKMMTHKIKEVPVVDDQDKIVADITMVDLLKYCKHYFLNNDR
ncbi:MAG: CBS domain-containing protein [Thermodesulfobacteriota bacterium]